MHMWRAHRMRKHQSTNIETPHQRIINNSFASLEHSLPNPRPLHHIMPASSSRKKSRGRGGKAQAQAAAEAAGVNTHPASPEFAYAQATSGGNNHMPTADEILAISMGTAVADGAEINDDAPSGAAEEALEDVHTRFILNLPDEEFESADRIFFQLEQGETTFIYIHTCRHVSRSFRSTRYSHILLYCLIMIISLLVLRGPSRRRGRRPRAARHAQDPALQEPPCLFQGYVQVLAPP